MGVSSDSEETSAFQQTRRTYSRKQSGTVKEGILQELVPESWKPFVRLLRLTSGALLTFWPCAWGTTLVAIETELPLREFAAQIVRFYVWAVLAHTIGSIWNDMCDRDFDKQVARTKDRPLASGKISMTTARITIAVLSASWIWGIWGLNSSAFRTALVSMFGMSVIYPIMKRVTNWPQAWLAVTINMGMIVGWLQYKEANYLILTAFMVAGWCWMMITDVWYGYMDRADDVKAGVKSAALSLGDHPQPALLRLSFICAASLTIVGILSNQPFWYYTLTVAGAAFHLVWQINTTDVKDPHTCSDAFHSNGTQFGYIVWSGLLVSYMKSVGVLYL